MTEKITLFIGGHEGFVSTWYLDPTGTPTIGYGFTWASEVFRNWWMQKYGRKFRRGDTMSQADAAQVLEHMIASEYRPPVDRALPRARKNQRDGATSTVYNAGPGALQWKWAQALARGDVSESARLLRTTAVTSRGRRLPGLVRRRAEEADIIERNVWPTWLDTSLPAPQTHVVSENIRQAQIWLAQLGYEPGPADGVMGQRTRAAVTRFQQDHGTLRVDGIIGPATLDALQRTIDLQKKAGGVAGGGGVVAGAGATENATGASSSLPLDGLGWVGDVLLWGGLAIVVAGLVWLAWRYQDEINTLLRRL